MGNTKAVHIKSLQKFVHQLGGPEAWNRLLTSLDPADRRAAERSYSSTEWLDCGLWWRLLETADRVLAAGDGRLIRTVGAFDARESLNGVYRVFMTILKPEAVVKRCPQIWRQYYDAGTMTLAKLGAREAELQLSEFPGLPVRHELELLGWMEEALRMTGNKTVVVAHPGPCLARGDAHCLFTVRWE